jgi:sugar-phosphatase
MAPPVADSDRRTEHQDLVLHVPLLLFDLDGTLIDSVPAIEDAWRTWAAEESIEHPAVAAFHGRTAFDLVSSLVPSSGAVDAVNRLRALEERPSVPVPVMPGALELISAVTPGRWGIVTSAARSVAHARLAAAGVPVPELMVTGDDVANGKPHPEPYLRGLRRAAGSTAAVAFEDTVAGLRSARAAGCVTIGVIGTATAQELVLHADALVRSLGDVSVASCDHSGICLHVRSFVAH